MKILVIDTSGPVCGTAVMDEEKVYCEFTAQNRNTHSASLMPMIEASLKAAGTDLSGIGAVAAVKGFPLSKDLLRKTLADNVPPKFLDLNLKAFDLGYDAMQ